MKKACVSATETGELWTAVEEGGFYGWPCRYYEERVDRRVKPPRPDLVDAALVPDYALEPHTASPGLASALPRRFADDVGNVVWRVASSSARG